MAAVEFSIGNDILMDLGNPVVPLVNYTPRTIWSSSEITVGSIHNSASIFVVYTAFSPDTDVVSPFNFEVVAVIEQKQADNSWLELARQNMPIRKLESGATRQIIISPVSTLQEEGVDQVIAGFSGVPVSLKSRFVDSAEGTLRVCVAVIDNDVDGPNPFVSVTASIHGKRYDA